MALDIESYNPYRRSREIGEALARARRRLGLTQDECANHIGTSRKRYGGIERGVSRISAVELEQLVAFLQIPPYDVWPAHLIAPHTIQVRARPGESVFVIIENPGTPSNTESKNEPGEPHL